MKIFLGADHGGYQIKQNLIEWIKNQPQLSTTELTDYGATTLNEGDDYPDFGIPVAQAVNQSNESYDQNPASFGILICRSGGGMGILANRFPHVRAVICRNEQDVQHAREHNNANILILEGNHVSPEQAHQLTQKFLQTPFGKDRHIQRLQKIANIQT